MKEMDLSFVFPCLNEEKTIPVVIRELQEVMKTMPVQAEIIISDNGSTDNSVTLAEELGCRVVHAEKKGYGEALKKGFQEAEGKYIAFADIDGSYPLEYLPKMYEQIVKHDLDMVIASRVKGKIEKGAMPFLHRYLGTPVLTKVINLLFRGKLSDCNSGFRIFKKEAYQKWDVRSSGMEFASELLIKALKTKSKMKEVSAGLRVDKRDHAPHLQTWRDGMRHLLFILSEAPKFFEIIGLALMGFSILGEVLSMLLGPVQWGNMVVLNYHSKLILLGMMILGVYSYLFSANLYVLKPKEKPIKITKGILALSEETLFAICVGSVFCVVIGLGIFITFWASNSFHGIEVVSPLLDAMYWLLFILMFSFGLVQVHLFKRI